MLDNCRCLRARAPLTLLLAVTIAGPLLLSADVAEARRFGAAFSSAGKAAGSARRAARSADEVARFKQIESRIDWGAAAKKGLDIVKSAIEQAASLTSSNSSSTPSSGAAARSEKDSASPGPDERSSIRERTA